MYIVTHSLQLYIMLDSFTADQFSLTHLLNALGTPSSRPDQATLNTCTLSGAISAVKAWGCYVEMLGSQFLQKDPPVGQPMLKVGPDLHAHHTVFCTTHIACNTSLTC